MKVRVWSCKKLKIIGMGLGGDGIRCARLPSKHGFLATCERGSRATLAMLNVLALANLHQQQKKGIDIAPSMHQLHYQNSPALLCVYQ